MAQKIERKAEATWHGTLKDGKGKLSVGSGTLKDTAYTWATRFSTDKGANPEELLGAAHASCYAMFLSALLSQKDYYIHHINAEATVYLNPASPPTITHIKLTVRAKVDDLEADMFQTQAEEAKRGCPLSKALASVPIELDAKLE